MFETHKVSLIKSSSLKNQQKGAKMKLNCKWIVNGPRGSWFECFFCKTAKKLFVTGFMEENETLAYQYEDARETKLWKKVIAASWRPFWLLALWWSSFARLLW